MSSTDEHSAVLAALRECEQRIKASDGQSVVARWEFGRTVLRLREGRKQLPKGLLAEIVEEHGLSKTEIWQRVRFAEMFPTEDEVLAHARTYPTWDRIKREALPKKPTTAARQNAGNVTAHAHEARRLAVQLAKDDPASLTDADRRAYQKLHDALSALLGVHQ